MASAQTHQLTLALHAVTLLARVDHARPEREGGGALVAPVFDVWHRLARDRPALRRGARPLSILGARASGVTFKVVPFVTLVRGFGLEGDVRSHDSAVGRVGQATAVDGFAHGVGPVPRSALVAASPHVAHQLVAGQAAAGDDAVEGEVRALDLTVVQVRRRPAVDGLAARRQLVPIPGLQALDDVVALNDVAGVALVDDSRQEGVLLAVHAGVRHERRLAALHQHALGLPRLPLAGRQAGQGARGVHALLVQRVAKVTHVPVYTHTMAEKGIRLSSDRQSHRSLQIGLSSDRQSYRSL